MKKIKVGLIGYGNSGKIFHAPLLQAHPGFEIAKVSSSKTSEVSKSIPSAKIVTEASAIFSDPEIELVVNCTPNTFHYLHTKTALEHGKHVVVEKPFVNTMLEGAELISIAKKRNLRLSVFHNRRFDADFLTLQNLIAAGKLGTIQQFESHFDRFRPSSRFERWREQNILGSGMFYDLGAHLIDQAVQLFGFPEQVFADIQSQKADAQADDYFHVIFYYGKTRVILHSSSYSTTSPRFQVFGEQATFVKYGLDPQEEQLKNGMSPTDLKVGMEDPKNYGTLTHSADLTSEKITSENGNYLRFYDELYSALTEPQKKLPVTAEEALQTIQLIEIAIESSKRGKIISLTRD